MPAPASIQERTARITASVLQRCDLTLLLLDARTGKHMLSACVMASVTGAELYACL